MKLYPYYDLWEPTQEEKRRYSLNLSKDFPATTIDIVLQTKDLYSNPVILRLFSSLFLGGQKGSFPYSSKDFVSKIQTYQIYTCDIPETFHLSYAYDIPVMFLRYIGCPKIYNFEFYWYMLHNKQIFIKLYSTHGVFI